MTLPSHYCSVITNLKEVIFQADLDGHLTKINPAWTKITGFSQQQSLGTALLSYIHSQDQVEAQQQLKLLQLGLIKECRFQVRYHAQDESIGWLDFYVCPRQNQEGMLVGISGSIADITENKALEQRLSIEGSVSAVLAEVVSLGEAYPKLLKAICLSLDWEYGELWMPVTPAGQPECVESWCRNLNSDLAEGVDRDREPATNSSIFGLATELIPQVWARDGLTWLTSLAPDPHSSCPMRSAPMRTALSMPIQDGYDLLGVMLFFKRAYQPIDKPLLKRLGVIG
ncbi:MAG: PAS domain S-box protein, partial [Acaryochloridaceae cyanobacterium SU_2_1]|nr:PAS domain S-box protein [Acaryochloridaceae cyanobacterium SU_2_1]